MANEPHIYSAKFDVPLDLTRKMTTTLQALGKEWTGFVGARLREDSQLYRTLSQCKELPSMQRAYMEFWQKALSQYEEEAQRLMRITRGAVEGAVQVAQESAKASSDDADDAEPSNRPTMISAMKKSGSSNADKG
jgi:cation transport regulator ChaB